MKKRYGSYIDVHGRHVYTGRDKSPAGTTFLPGVRPPAEPGSTWDGVNWVAPPPIIRPSLEEKIIDALVAEGIVPSSKKKNILARIRDA